MTEAFKILIAERSRNVREFLRRELLDEGYRVKVAGHGRELLLLIATEDPPDLLILDPDIPSSLPTQNLLRLLHQTTPALPVMVHTFPNGDWDYLKMPGVVACLEKKADIDPLKKEVAELIGERYPVRFRNFKELHR